MKYALIFLFFSFTTLGQEICTNGLDDDNDGFIDLNDKIDCFCDAYTIDLNTNTLLPNPSFEEFNCVPTVFTQLALGADGIFCVNNWQTGTTGSSDYFINSSGAFWPNIPTPLSNGIAATGFFIINNPDVTGFDGSILDGVYMEYLKTCLNSPLIAGNSYVIQMNLVGLGMSSSGNALTSVWFGPVDITLYGSANCTQSPEQTVACPIGFSDWEEIGHISYQADGKWQNIIFQFTALKNMESIMIGGPCYPPADFYFKDNNGESFEPYFAMDYASMSEINVENCSFDLIFPNVITPNSDGMNDLFEIKNLPKNTEVIILNRWGNVVYSSIDYKNNWDGKNSEGKELADGVYYFTFKTTTQKNGSGIIQLIR